MADEDKLKVHSLPPPPTDEIDEDWGSSGTAPTTPRSGTEVPRTEPSKPAEQPKKKASRPAPDDDEDDEDDDDDVDDDDDDDEDVDDDEDDEDDDDDDDDRRHAKPRGDGRSSIDDLIPDWMPWGVLGGLLLFGFLGGIGVLGLDCNLKRAEATGEPAPSAAAAATTTAAAPRPTAARSAVAPKAEDGEMVAASHLLVAYQGALRAAPTTTRTKEEAKKRATEAQKKAKKGADFEKLVSEYSDEPGAAQRGGRLGKFTRGRMVKEFADAAFAMKVGDISDVVETKFGFHVIKRTE